MATSKGKTYFLPINDPNAILEGCEILLHSLVTRIIEGNINGRTNYTNESTIKRVKVTKIVIEYVDKP